MDTIFNTGETQLDLKNKYNPEGSLRRDVQLRLLDMLLYLDSVCQSLDIPYRLDGGNVLGALRHGGFIPWDDDVDVVVEKKYYNKLCKYLVEHPHPQYVLQSKETDKGYLRFWNTLRDVKSEYVHKQQNDLNNAFVYKGLQIDLFCYVPGIIPFLHKLSGIIFRNTVIPFASKSFGLARFAFVVQDLILNPLFYVLTLVFGNKNYYMHCYGTTFPSRFHKDIVVPHKPIVFEGHEFPGPANPEQFCEIIYGNWRDLPSVDNRNHHDVNYVLFD